MSDPGEMGAWRVAPQPIFSIEKDLCVREKKGDVSFDAVVNSFNWFSRTRNITGRDNFLLFFCGLCAGCHDPRDR